jgi:hypothetical protein
MTVWHPTDDGHADISAHDSYVNGTPHNTFKRLRDEDPTNVLVPKRLIANIEGGKLCWQNSCISLPIQGEGLFDGVYLGERLRIGQNVNGSGARVVQVRLS